MTKTLQVGDMVWFHWNEAGLREVKQIVKAPDLAWMLSDLPPGKQLYNAVFHEIVPMINTDKPNRWFFWMPDEVDDIFETYQPVEMIHWVEENDRWEFHP